MKITSPTSPWLSASRPVVAAVRAVQGGTRIDGIKGPGPGLQGHVDPLTGLFTMPKLPDGTANEHVVAVLGDSISDQTYYNRLGGKTWASHLIDRYRKQGKPTLLWVSAAAGVSGSGRQRPDEIDAVNRARTSARQRLSQLLPAKPGTIVLEFGANDYRVGASAAEFEVAMLSMIQTIRLQSPSTRIVVMGLKLPSDYMRGTPRRRAAYKNAFARIRSHLSKLNHGRASEGRPKHVFVGDIFDGLTKDNRLDGTFRNGNDPIHPSDQGQRRIALKMAGLLDTTDGHP